MKNLYMAFDRLAKQGMIRPNYYTGDRRWTRCSSDYAGLIVQKLESLGMSEGKHFEFGNDAPSGGHTGKWVRLTSLGKRRKVIRYIRATSKVEE